MAEVGGSSPLAPTKLGREDKHFAETPSAFLWRYGKARTPRVRQFYPVRGAAQPKHEIVKGRRVGGRGHSDAHCQFVTLPQWPIELVWRWCQLFGGQAAPVDSQRCSSAWNSCWPIGGGVRPRPGVQAHCTSGSFSMWMTMPFARR